MAEETSTAFNHNDIYAAVALIDHACSKGAFLGWEDINKAFVVRQRLNQFAVEWEAAVNAASEMAENVSTETPEQLENSETES